MAKKNSNKKTLLIVLTIFGILLFAAALKIYEEVLASNVNLPENEKAFLYIHTNKSFDENLYLIEETGILKNTQSLGRLMRIAGYTELIKPGKYEINNAMNNIELMRLLVSGRQQPFDIVFKYAQRNSDIAGFWGQQLEADSVELIELLNSNAFCDSLGFTPQTIIGMFIPNTYNFYWNTSS
ncbi:MAG: endolytic transglycosylase MltG, partial [Bacteroidia bacterium]|nr:endolytic transglycosylase MltG [Bacteroidia bacterium]